jgi:hypothetical protein
MTDEEIKEVYGPDLIHDGYGKMRTLAYYLGKEDSDGEPIQKRTLEEEQMDYVKWEMEGLEMNEKKKLNHQAKINKQDKQDGQSGGHYNDGLDGLQYDDDKEYDADGEGHNQGKKDDDVEMDG